MDAFLAQWFNEFVKDWSVPSLWEKSVEPQNVWQVTAWFMFCDPRVSTRGISGIYNYGNKLVHITICRVAEIVTVYTIMPIDIFMISPATTH